MRFRRMYHGPGYKPVVPKSKTPNPSSTRIDHDCLAEHYGFTDEELDFIINYDIKYRMGRGG